MRLNASFAIAAVTLLAACSTGVVPTDQDKYMISTNGAPMASSESMKADVYTDANKFCAAKGLKVETVSIKTQNNVPFVHRPSATLEFRCTP